MVNDSLRIIVEAAWAAIRIHWIHTQSLAETSTGCSAPLTLKINGHQVKGDACSSKEGLLYFGYFGVPLAEMSQNGPVSSSLQHVLLLHANRFAMTASCYGRQALQSHTSRLALRKHR